MSTWSGTFQIVNNTGGAIYNGQASHTAAGTQGNVAITIPGGSGLATGATLGGGTWVTETTSRDFWSWNYSNAAGQPFSTTSKQCSMYHGDTSVSITINSNGGGTITPNSSSPCST
jgi:pyruvate/2-oxoglutarate/acetoin dehydrogenase E1 component